MKFFLMIFSFSLLFLPQDLKASNVKHAISPVYHLQHIKSDEGQSYIFHSPGFSYSLTTGEKIGFLGRFTVFFPRGLQQDGKSFTFSDYYDSGYGGDIAIGASLKLPFYKKFLGIVALAAHISGFKITGPLYNSFYSFTAGVAVDGQLYYSINKNFDVGGFLQAGWDFSDLIHEKNALKYAFHLCMGLSLGLHFR